MIRAITLVALVLFAGPSSAQVPGGHELPAEGQVHGASGTAAKADIYCFAGEMGARESYSLTTAASRRTRL